MPECWSCGKSYEAEGPIVRASECPHCAAWLRSCRNCHFYDQYAPNKCREPQADLQADKEAANACDYFRAAGIGKSGTPKKSKGDFDSLFKA